MKPESIPRLSAALFFLLLAALLVLTYYPDLPDTKIRVRGEWFRLDYIGHLGFYAALTVSFLVWRAGWRKRVSNKLLIFTLLGGFALGSLTELTQLAVPGRSMNPVDLLYNCLGILAGIMVTRIVSVIKNYR